MSSFQYQIISKSSNSFGDLIVCVSSRGETKTLTFQEGSWPDALQLVNEIKHAFGRVVGE